METELGQEEARLPQAQTLDQRTPLHPLKLSPLHFLLYVSFQDCEEMMQKSYLGREGIIRNNNCE